VYLSAEFIGAVIAGFVYVACTARRVSAVSAAHASVATEGVSA
jgi:hypothetical protein